MFDIYQRSPFDTGDLDDEALEDYIDGLMNEFADSPEAAPVIESQDGLGWAAVFIRYGGEQLGLLPHQMSAADAEEVIFEVFPRKVSTPAESAEEIIVELRAFWQFLGRAYRLSSAKSILHRALGPSAVDDLHAALADPRNFGMAKSFFMKGQEAGFDMTSQEGMTQFMLAYNASILGNPGMAGAVEPDEEEFEPEPPPKVKKPPIPLKPLTRKEREKRQKALLKAKQRQKRRG